MKKHGLKKQFLVISKVSTDKLEVIVVDDCSTDNSVAKINTTIED